ncbi:hypothetical protein [Streptomyces sp.]|uniref:hypothetical protein n=1 Tax=Streptomyces sp. TaxID=1931 RepID=UPI002F926E84
MSAVNRAADVLAKAGVLHAQLRYHYAEALAEAGLLDTAADEAVVALREKAAYDKGWAEALASLSTTTTNDITLGATTS